MHDSLAKDKEYIVQIQEHLISSNIEPFQFPRAKVEPKTKTSIVVYNIHSHFWIKISIK
jgi:hypothetical protein